MIPSDTNSNILFFRGTLVKKNIFEEDGKHSKLLKSNDSEGYQIDISNAYFNGIGSYRKRNHVWELRSEGLRTFYFETNSAGKMQEWIEALSLAKNNHISSCQRYTRELLFSKYFYFLHDPLGEDSFQTSFRLEKEINWTNCDLKVIKPTYGSTWTTEVSPINTVTSSRLKIDKIKIPVINTIYTDIKQDGTGRPQVSVKVLGVIEVESSKSKKKSQSVTNNLELSFKSEREMMQFISISSKLYKVSYLQGGVALAFQDSLYFQSSQKNLHLSETTAKLTGGMSLAEEQQALQHDNTNQTKGYNGSSVINNTGGSTKEHMDANSSVPIDDPKLAVDSQISKSVLANLEKAPKKVGFAEKTMRFSTLFNIKRFSMIKHKPSMDESIEKKLATLLDKIDSQNNSDETEPKITQPSQTIKVEEQSLDGKNNFSMNEPASLPPLFGDQIDSNEKPINEEYEKEFESRFDSIAEKVNSYYNFSENKNIMINPMSVPDILNDSDSGSDDENIPLSKVTKDFSGSAINHSIALKKGTDPNSSSQNASSVNNFSNAQNYGSSFKGSADKSKLELSKDSGLKMENSVNQIQENAIYPQNGEMTDPQIYSASQYNDNSASFQNYEAPFYNNQGGSQMNPNSVYQQSLMERDDRYMMDPETVPIAHPEMQFTNSYQGEIYPEYNQVYLGESYINQFPGYGQNMGNVGQFPTVNNNPFDPYQSVRTSSYNPYSGPMNSGSNPLLAHTVNNGMGLVGDQAYEYELESNNAPLLGIKETQALDKKHVGLIGTIASREQIRSEQKYRDSKSLIKGRQIRRFAENRTNSGYFANNSASVGSWLVSNETQSAKELLAGRGGFSSRSMYFDSTPYNQPHGASGLMPGSLNSSQNRLFHSPSYGNLFTNSQDNIRNSSFIYQARGKPYDDDNVALSFSKRETSGLFMTHNSQADYDIQSANRGYVNPGQSNIQMGVIQPTKMQSHEVNVLRNSHYGKQSKAYPGNDHVRNRIGEHHTNAAGKNEADSDFSVYSKNDNVLSGENDSNTLKKNESRTFVNPEPSSSKQRSDEPSKGKHYGTHEPKSLEFVYNSSIKYSEAKVFEDFIEKCIESKPYSKTTSSNLYNAYTSFCTRNGIKKEDKTSYRDFQTMIESTDWNIKPSVGGEITIINLVVV
ncbi:hypothetical protein BB560_003826 [Smittium megazygosporum]|uniref:PH domain-containing protein n=1 Tax=Smittium megazygosporum TaxID=133381 RepID=A0A2T9ZB05_9FUNG|nr:hypothetical protein BB560_003826 [Smittium megazygosporum]